MTITEANQIWNDCYGTSGVSPSWGKYTSAQRLLAIEIRQQEHDRQRGCWGTWSVSDRH
jgi:hypothetical protein